MKACVILAVLVGVIVQQVYAGPSKCITGGTGAGVSAYASLACTSANYCVKFVQAGNTAKACHIASQGLCTKNGENKIGDISYWCCDTDDCNSSTSIVSNKFFVLASLTLSVLFAFYKF